MGLGEPREIGIHRDIVEPLRESAS
jgi:hypothetical protein